MSLFFSIEHTTVELNGHVCEGWSEDEDAFMVPDIELANIIRGADGKMLAISLSNRGGEITLKFLPTSRSAAFFAQQAAQIRLGAAVIFNGQSVNSQTGVSLRMERGVLKQAPMGQTQGKGAAAAREFVFEFESLIPNYDANNFTAPPEVAAS